MTQRRRLCLECILVFLLTALYLAPLLPLGLNLYDEGILLHGAERVLEGEVPYFDFFAYYGPAYYYWPAMLFKVFGRRILAVRLGGIVFASLATSSAFAMCRRAGLTMPWSLLPAMALVLPVSSGVALTLWSIPLSFILAAGAVLTGGSAGGRREFIAGVLLGLASVFRHDFGVYGIAAGGAAAFWRYWRRAAAVTDRPSGRLTHVLLAIRRLQWILGGFALVAVPVYGLLALRDVRQLVSVLLVEPLKMTLFRSIPYGYYELQGLDASVEGHRILSETIIDLVNGIVLLTPFATLTVCAGLLVRQAGQAIAANSGRMIALVFVLVASAGFAVYALGRSDVAHIYPLHVLSVCAVSIFWGAPSTSIRLRLSSLSTAALVGITFALGATFVARTVPFAGAERLGIAGGSRIQVPATLSWIREAVQAIESHGAEGPILVAGERHDRVYINAAILYFFSDRRSGTYYFDFIPGVTTSSSVQERIVSDLRKNYVRTVVIWKMKLPDEPNRSRESSGVRILDEFLRSEFRPVKRESDYEILVRHNSGGGDLGALPR
jgi:hypothetical protein